MKTFVSWRIFRSYSTCTSASGAGDTIGQIDGPNVVLFVIQNRLNSYHEKLVIISGIGSRIIMANTLADSFYEA